MWKAVTFSRQEIHAVQRDQIFISTSVSEQPSRAIQ
jgi:hypothetical protein